MSRQAIQSEATEGYRWTPAITEGSPFPFRAIIAFIAIVASWMLFSQVLVPSIIKSAYRGESLPFLNGLISGQAIHPVEFYLTNWERDSWHVLGMLVMLGLIPLPLVVTRPGIQNYMESRYVRVLAVSPVTINAFIALFGFGLVFWLYYFHPVGHVYFITEDHWAEYGSFISWAMAFCFLSWILFTNRSSRKPGLFLLTIFTLVVALEEVSWGQRMLALPSPAFFTEYNFQQETNVHNLVQYPLGTMGAIGSFVWGVVLPASTTKWRRIRELCERSGIPIVPVELWPFFLLAVFFLFTSSPALKGEEAGELFLGLAVAALSLNLVLTARTGLPAQRESAAAATVSMIATIGISTAIMVHCGSSPDALRYRLNQFAAVRFPEAGMYEHAEIVFEYIDENPGFLQAETHFQHGVLLSKMKKHTKAKQLLELALAEQHRLQKETPEKPGPYRIAGQVLTLLQRPEEAKAAFGRAIENDRARLERTTDAKAEGRVRWSLARTLLASGDSGGALEQSLRARALVSDQRTRFLIEHWLKENFD